MTSYTICESPDEFPAGSLRSVVVAGNPICVVRTTDGEFFAVIDRCTHEDYPLSEGELEGHELECPLHGSIFDIRTGEVLSQPALLPVQTFVVRRDGDRVSLDLPQYPTVEKEL